MLLCPVSPADPLRRNPSSDDDLALGVEGKVILESSQAHSDRLNNRGSELPESLVYLY